MKNLEKNENQTRSTPQKAKNHILNAQQIKPEVWIQEEIFGHRYIEEQKPFMLVLETLSVISYMYHSEQNVLGFKIDENHEVKEIFDDSFGHDIKILAIRSTPLRYILFKDKKIEKLLTDKNVIKSDHPSDEWIKTLKKRYLDACLKNETEGKNNKNKSQIENDPVDLTKYLKKEISNRMLERDLQAFDVLKEYSYESIIQAVKLLKSIEIDALSKRRWTSRFLTPRGSYLIYSDIDDRNMSLDRRFFGRGGEIIFLMLYRAKSSIKEALSKKIVEVFFKTDDPYHQIAGKFLNYTNQNHVVEDQLAKSFIDPKYHDHIDQMMAEKRLAIGYLSEIKHPCYDQLASDWLAILNLNTLGISQKFALLFRITALNLIRYISERSQYEINQENSISNEPFPLDATNGTQSELVSLSKVYLNRIRQMISEAIKVYIERLIDEEYENKTKEIIVILEEKMGKRLGKEEIKLVSIMIDFYYKDKNHTNLKTYINVSFNLDLDMNQILEIGDKIDLKNHSYPSDINNYYKDAIESLQSSFLNDFNINLSNENINMLSMLIDGQNCASTILKQLQIYLDPTNINRIETIFQKFQQKKEISHLNRILEKKFHVNLTDGEKSKIFELIGNHYQDRLNDFIEKVQKRSRNNVSTLIEPLGKEIGLINQRSGSGAWLSCSDDLLEALVLTQVTQTITLTDFLSNLYEKYRIVIAPIEATKAFKTLPCDISSFEINLHAFEKRLSGLGYVKRLSDDCAFISNPYIKN